MIRAEQLSAAQASLPEWAVPVTILFVLLALGYVGMWFGWRRRATKHDLPPLHAAPAEAGLPRPVLEAGARYFGTTADGDWLDRVVAHGLGSRSSVRMSLSAEGLDVLRPARSFRIPAGALRAVRHDQGIAGKVVPPHGLLVVTWQHGDRTLDSGFRLEPSHRGRGRTPGTVTDTHNQWVSTISTLVGEHKEHTA
jgi:hypothetical protein